MRKQLILIPVILLLTGYYFFFLRGDNLTYTITVDTNPGGSIAPSDEVIINAGEEQGFTITPDPNYHIAGVLIDGLNIGPVGSYVFTDISADHNITVAFEADEYTLTVNIVGDGTVILDPTKPTYNHGDTVEFIAIPDPGWGFSTWSNDLASSDNPATFIITGDQVITASFTEETWSITATTGPGGSITPMGVVQVSDQDSQLFTITPDEGYVISEVIVDGETAGAIESYTYTEVKADHSISAWFQKTTADDGGYTLLWNHQGEIYDIKSTGTGEYIAASSAFVFNYYIAINSEPIWTSINEYEAIYWAVAVSDNGDIAVVGDETGRINFFTDTTSKNGYISSAWSSGYLGKGVKRDTLDLSNSGDTLAVAGKNGMIHIFRDCTTIKGNNLAADYLAETSAADIIKLILSDDGKTLLACGTTTIEGSQRITLDYIDTVTETTLWSWVSPFTGTPYDVEMSETSDVVAMAFTDHTHTTSGLYFWKDASTLRGVLPSSPSWSYTRNTDSIVTVAMSNNGNTITASLDDTLLCWSDTSQPIVETANPDWSKSINVQDLEITSDGNKIILTALNGEQWQILVYSANEELLDMINADSPITNLAISSDGNIIAFAQDYNRINILQYSP